MICRRVVVHGSVQGVFFRDTCRRKAREAGVSGWVRNNHDGTVEAVFEGPEDDVESLCRWCGEGPEGADVSRVDVDSCDPQNASGFDVRG